MQELIDGVLEYSRAGRRRPDFPPVDVADLAHEIVGELAASVRAREARVTIGDLPVVMGDRMLLRQVLQRTCWRTREVRREAALEVAIEAQFDATLTRVSITDNGIGIEPRDAERIFDMFQRLHTRKRTRGPGSALALAKRIVELHGGRIAWRWCRAE